jgi:type VI secretion system protein VasJ
VNDLSSLGKQPVSDAAPCGQDVRDETDFDLLQNEIGKMSNPASGPPDWQQVVQLSTNLLTNKGKDILVVCYLAGGLLQTRSISGLADGARILADMMQTWWDQLYPPLARLRARRNALQWLIDRVRAHSDETDWTSLPPQDPAMVQGLRDAFNAIDAVLLQKDSEAPSLLPLRTLLNGVPLVTVAPPAAEAGEAGGAAASAAGRQAGGGAGSAAGLAASSLASGALNSAESVDQAAGEALERLADIGEWLAENDRTNPLGFRLRRVAAWSGIEHTPPEHSGQTLLPGPIAAVQDALRSLLARLANEDIVSFAETQLRIFPFWLDLNCVAAEALGRLGEPWLAAQREVRNETAKLVDRLPGVELLKFADGTPFANGDTLMWLQTVAAAAGGNAGTAMAQDPLQAVMLRARALAADDDLAGAADCLQDAIEQHAAPAARLRLRTALCDLLLEHRPGARLDSFARAMVAEIDRFGVCTWDPTQAVEGLRAAYAILSRNDENQAEADALLARIAPLNAAAAVRLII